MIAFIYVKHIKNSKDGKTFDKFFMSYKGHTFELSLWEEANAKLVLEMKKNKLTLPLDIEFTEDMYYMKRVSFTRKDGTNGSKDRIYLKDFLSIKQAQYTKRTLDMSVEGKEEKVEIDPTAE